MQQLTKGVCVICYFLFSKSYQHGIPCSGEACCHHCKYHYFLQRKSLHTMIHIGDQSGKMSKRISVKEVVAEV